MMRTCQFETTPWAEVGDQDRSAWARFRDRRPELASPYLSIEWADAVQRARGDLQLLRVFQDGRLCALLPYHRGRLGALRPAGGPLNDGQGFIAERGVDISPREVVRRLGCRGLRFADVSPTDPCFGDHGVLRDAFSLDLSQGYDAYLSRQSRAQPKAFRNLRARTRRLDGHEVSLRLDDRDPATLDQLLELKRDQYRRTGQIDVFGHDWTRNLIRSLFETPAGSGLRGRLSSLWIDGALAAAHFGLQEGEILHYWFPAFDRAFAEFSPGHILLQRLARALPEEGVRRIDLGGGDYRFKAEFADQRRPVVSGVVRNANLLGSLVAAAQGVAAVSSRLPLGPVSRLPVRALRRADRYLSFHEAGQAAA
ncbi:MAG: GNAT family N-acetyltransferase [Caulobacteraceae bacterium]|nr:GNAT family N-acetyltransferase [Caulobacteraceae bacterium]